MKMARVIGTPEVDLVRLLFALRGPLSGEQDPPVAPIDCRRRINGVMNYYDSEFPKGKNLKWLISQ